MPYQSVFEEFPAARRRRGGRKGRGGRGKGRGRPEQTGDEEEEAPKDVSEEASRGVWDNSERYAEREDEDQFSDDGYDMEELSKAAEVVAIETESVTKARNADDVLTVNLEVLNATLGKLPFHVRIGLSDVEAGIWPPATENIAGDQFNSEEEAEVVQDQLGSRKDEGDTAEHSYDKVEPAGQGNDHLIEEKKRQLPAAEDDFDTWLDSV
mmetsp:Transcript_9211/g.27732  ORF Transcript_9211/g.27732 Transcript_9211/m.27732 type:complete len:210 (+) Transcript_9211:173-802(+)